MKATKLKAFGEIKSIGAWSRDPRCKVSSSALAIRIQSGMTTETAIVTPHVTRAKDIAGKRFGRGVALFNTNERYDGKVVWDMLCDCGQNYKASISALQRGNVKSCGCLQRESQHENGKKSSNRVDNRRNIRGVVKGWATAVHPTKQRRKGRVVWKCKCVCGRWFHAPVDNFLTGHHRSCGCLRLVLTSLRAGEKFKIDVQKVINNPEEALKCLAQIQKRKATRKLVRTKEKLATECRRRNSRAS